MIQITLPDGSQREYPGPVTVAEVAASIGAGLAKAALAGNTVTKARQIDVDTRKGVVELHGFVDSQAEITEAVKEARAVSGVVDVRNDLGVKKAN
mgnify:CR=1 FL=1